MITGRKTPIKILESRDFGARQSEEAKPENPALSSSKGISSFFLSMEILRMNPLGSCM